MARTLVFYKAIPIRPRHAECRIFSASSFTSTMAGQRVLRKIGRSCLRGSTALLRKL